MKAMNDIEMILKILNEANKPLLSKEISKHIYHKFDGFEIDKKTIKDILWNDLKDEVFFNRITFEGNESRTLICSIPTWNRRVNRLRNYGCRTSTPRTYQTEDRNEND